MKTLKFTPEATSWLARNLTRLTVLNDNKSDDSKTAKLVKALEQKLTTSKLIMSSDGLVNIPLNRNDLRIIQQLVGNQKVILMTKTIPAYRSRGGMADRIKECEAKVALLTDIQEAVEGALR